MPTPGFDIFSNIFDWVNPFLTSFWPVAVYGLGILIGFGLLNAIIWKIENHFEGIDFMSDFKEDIEEAKRVGLVNAMRDTMYLKASSQFRGSGLRVEIPTRKKSEKDTVFTNTVEQPKVVFRH